MPTSGSPVGTTPFGLATPVAAPLPPTAGPALARYINPGSRDYQLDTSVGQLASMPAIRQRMMLSVFTEYKSSTVLPEFGIDAPRKIDGSFETKLLNSVRKACYQLTNIERSVRLDSIEIESDGVQGRRIITISYTDLTSLSEDDRNQILEVVV